MFSVPKLQNACEIGEKNRKVKILVGLVAQFCNPGYGEARTRDGLVLVDSFFIPAGCA